VSAGEPATPRCVQIPVLYGGDGGPDLDHVADHNSLTVDEVVSIHSRPQYLVYMLGFSPGFPYLGGMDERIETPRLDTPRTIIPAGSVGIAEKQTGVYPTATPGGWQIIGLTPLNFFDPDADPPSLLEPGDLIRFVPIDQDEFDAIADEVKQSVYQTLTEAPE
jgi:KipI family sensor histidine kinase inhibitor